MFFMPVNMRRANDNFNGLDPFGKRTLAPSGNPNKRLVVLDSNGNPTLGSLSIDNKRSGLPKCAGNVL